MGYRRGRVVLVTALVVVGAACSDDHGSTVASSTVPVVPTAAPSTVSAAPTTVPTVAPTVTIAAPTTVAATTVAATSPAPTTVAPTSAVPATTVAPPPPPTNVSTFEETGFSAPVVLDEVGAGTGQSKSFTPPGAVAPSQQGPGKMATPRMRVEWACAPGSSLTARVNDTSGDISGTLENGFDGMIPVSHPPVWVVFEVDGACSWHVRVLDVTQAFPTPTT